MGDVQTRRVVCEETKNTLTMIEMRRNWVLAKDERIRRKENTNLLIKRHVFGITIYVCVCGRIGEMRNN